MALVFKKRLRPTSPAELSPVEQDQLREAAERWDGGDHSDLEAFLSGDEGYVELHEVLDDGQRVYDAWVFPTDDASFFATATTVSLPFHVVQGGVEALEPGGDHALRTSLQVGYDGLFASGK